MSHFWRNSASQNNQTRLDGQTDTRRRRRGSRWSSRFTFSVWAKSSENEFRVVAVFALLRLFL